MKKIVLVAAAAGLISLAACNKPADTTSNNAADAAMMDNTAMGMEDASNATTNDMVANAMDSAPTMGNATTNTAM